MSCFILTYSNDASADIAYSERFCMFLIKVDKVNRFVSIELSGLMSDEECGVYYETLQREFISGIGHRDYIMLVDTTDLKIQPQSVVKVLTQRVSEFPKAVRLALVTGQSPVKMQLRRIVTRDNARYFDNRRTGERWLFDGWLINSARRSNT